MTKLTAIVRSTVLALVVMVRITYADDENSNTFKAYWKEGIRFDTADGAFKIKLGGRIQNDWAFFDLDDDLDDQVGEFEDGAEFRRARLYVSGTIYQNIEFKAQYDFAGGEVDFKDVYLGLTDLPFGGIRVGHFYEPFSLDEVTSDNLITFMERSLVSAFVPARNTGIMLHDHVLDDRMTWAAGVFRDSTGNEGGNEMGDEYSFTTRITGCPWYEDEGRRLVHFALAYSHREAQNETVDADAEFKFNYESRPESHLAGKLVGTMFNADSTDLVGTEAALVYGPFSLQAEYLCAAVNDIDGGGGDPKFSGFYVYGSYFLTGEHRPYNTSSAVFGRIKPTRNFRGAHAGVGAWEIAVRYSHLDLDDGDVNGGELDDITLGLNWYLNPNVRVMFNYVYADAEEKYDGQMHAFQTRFQIDF